MSDWRQVALGEICNIEIGGTPSRSEARYWWKTDNDGARLPWVSISDMKGKVITDTKESITEIGALQSNCKHVQKGTLLMSFKLTIGRLAFAGRDLYTNEAISAITPFKDVCPEFLYYGLQYWNLTGDSDQAVKGVTLNKQKLQEISCLLPPLPEQKKIAEILSGIDKVMDLTKRKLASERDLRAALLNEMIAENRPFLKLEMVATRVSGHTPSKSNSGNWNGGIPWVSLSDMAKLDKRFICDTSKEISEQGIRNSSAVLHPAGLVILSRDARVGCSAITAKKMAVSQHFIGWICSERLLNTYLYYVLQKWKKKFEAIAMGSTIATIGVPFFRDLEIPVPPINEQQKAASALESIDDSIDMLEGKIVCLESLKNALASDLLSGRKRVTL